MPEWNIIGRSRAAGAMRSASAFVEPGVDSTIVCDGVEIPAGALATGAAQLHPGAERVISELFGFRVCEDAWRMTRHGELGRLYCIYGSRRLGRGAETASVLTEGLAPLASYILAVVPQPVVRVWATNTSIESQDDGWFLTLRFADDLIVTLEALAVADPSTGGGTQLEIGGGDRGGGWGPTRQAVRGGRPGQATRLEPRGEDGAERLLEVIASGDGPIVQGQRLRAVWQAMLHSASSGQAIVVS